MDLMMDDDYGECKTVSFGLCAAQVSNSCMAAAESQPISEYDDL